MDKQRQVIYGERRKILEGEDIHDQALELATDSIEMAVREHATDEVHPEEWDWEQLFTRAREIFPTTLKPEDFDHEHTHAEDVVERFVEDGLQVYARREQELGTDELRQIERLVLLSVIDNRWREHLYEMDYLQEGIGLRAVGQRDPLVEYQREGFDMFVRMQEIIKDDFTRYVFHVEAVRNEERAQRPTQMREERREMPLASAGPPPVAEGDGVAVGGPGEPAEQAIAIEQAHSDKIPRNAPCPCGSGKKYKLCHGRAGAPPL
jgi:preprotein translocase subunit SecA